MARLCGPFLFLKVYMNTKEIKKFISELDNKNDSFAIVVSYVKDGVINTNLTLNNFITGDLLVIRGDITRLIMDKYSQNMQSKTQEELLLEGNAIKIKNSIQ
jgi:hypothetical protein